MPLICDVAALPAALELTGVAGVVVVLVVRDGVGELDTSLTAVTSDSST